MATTFITTTVMIITIIVTTSILHTRMERRQVTPNVIHQKKSWTSANSTRPSRWKHITNLPNYKHTNKHKYTSKWARTFYTHRTENLIPWLVHLSNTHTNNIQYKEDMLRWITPPYTKCVSSRHLQMWDCNNSAQKPPKCAKMTQN